MKRPSTVDLELAADWLESNEGDESADLARVAMWLRAQVISTIERDAARGGGVPVSALRKKLRSQATTRSPARSSSDPGTPRHGGNRQDDERGLGLLTICGWNKA